MLNEIIDFIKEKYMTILMAGIAILIFQTVIVYYFSSFYAIVAAFVISFIVFSFVYYVVWFANNYGVDIRKLKYFEIKIIGPALLAFVVTFFLLYTLNAVANYIAMYIKTNN